MSAQDRAIQKLARELAGIKKEVVSWRGPQADYTSIENGGNFTFKDGDGNVTAVVGGQDDGSNTIRHVDGPTPPVPSGLSAHVDGPIVQVSWDGTFEDADSATYDWSHLEVIAVGPNSENLRGTISDVTGASTNLAATVSGEWTVVARSVSRAERRSLDGDAGTVDVKLVDIDGAIEAVQDSANGKNQVTYSEFAPTPDDPGIFDDTWFVGQVGRPNDIVESTNLLLNPGGVPDGALWSVQGGSNGEITYVSLGDGTYAARNTNPSTVGNTFLTPHAGVSDMAVEPGRPYSASASVMASFATSVTVRVGWRNASGGYVAWSPTASVPVAAGEWATLALEGVLAPSGAAFAFVHFYADGQTSVSGRWLQATKAMTEQSATTFAPFDGDTPSGTTDNESHYRWTGTPHASTSEKYLPALTIGDSDTWNVIEQYRHDGTGWVKVELSHYVFSSVDLGKATVGELDGIRIAAQTIRGQQLSGDAIDGKVITGPIIQSARDGQRWVGDTSGIRIFNADNEVRTQLSPDDSVFKGEVEADTLVVNEGAEFKANSTLAQGASLLLAAGVTDPTAPPTVQPFWDGLEFDNPAGVTRKVGLAFDGTNYWTANPDGLSSAFNFVRINATTGASTTFSSPVGPAGGEWFGVTCIGSELFWLYRRGYEGRILVTDLNCVKKRETSWNIGYSKTSPLAYKPGIGNDGTNIVIAQCTDAGRLDIHTCNKTTGALISTINDPTDITRSDITGVYVGNADWGRKLATVAKASTSELPSFSATTGVYDGAATKFGAAATGSVGVVFVDGKFHTLDPTGTIHEYADSNTGDDSGDWWATYYWYTDVDDDNIIESSDYQSRMAPPKRFTWPTRAGLKILGQPMPTGVGDLGPALAKKTSTPTRTDFHCPGWIPDSGKPSARYTDLPTNWTTFAAPSDTNTFPESTPSVLRSASSTFEVDGAGKGRWGQLEFDRYGRVRGLTVSGTVDQPNVPTNGGVVESTITFPDGRFEIPPVVFVQATNGAVNAVVDRITATTCRIRSWNFTTYNVATNNVTWTAIGGGV